MCRLHLMVAATAFGILGAISGDARAQDLPGMVPQDIRERGYIEIVTDPSFGPPWSYHPGDDQSEYAGIDVDIANEFSKRLDLEPRFVSLGFAAIIPALKSGRFDMAMAGMSDTEERGKQIDMIDYALDSTTLLVQAGNPKNIRGLEDLCGLSVAGVTGSIQLAMAEEQSPKCDEPINITAFPTKSDAVLQVETKRMDATLDGYIVSGYLTKEGVLGQKNMEAVFEAVLNPKPLGIGVAKGNAELRDAVVAAINSMIQDGTYQKIFAKWGDDNMPLKAADVNNFRLGQE
ncbi:ABC transporter substrate-binding protein [uncultured Nitratireductor sp.]|uniref:ABC transporter substrate-binding protein n=1 Tax=uncultured Nitratireductor sp. TaxID=520953 RepID=UPI0025EF5938|nr:ABC transporter substrate-binding protein [uncultured Nitratireductor sp.]